MSLAKVDVEPLAQCQSGAIACITCHLRPCTAYTTQTTHSVHISLPSPCDHSRDGCTVAEASWHAGVGTVISAETAFEGDCCQLNGSNRCQILSSSWKGSARSLLGATGLQ